MDFGRQRGFLLDGEDPPEKVGCRKKSYLLEFMNVDFARDFVGEVFNVLLDGAKGSHNHRDCCCFELPHSLNLDFQVLVFGKLFRGFDCWCRGIQSCQLLSRSIKLWNVVHIMSSIGRIT